MTTVESQNIYGSLKIYLKTKSYDHLFDVLRQPGPTWILR